MPALIAPCGRSLLDLAIQPLDHLPELLLRHLHVSIFRRHFAIAHHVEHFQPPINIAAVQEIGVERIDAELRSLLAEMRDNNVRWAFCIGMPGVGAYSADEYVSHIRAASDALYPVGMIDFSAADSLDELRRQVHDLAELGFVGVKVHPRLSGVTYGDSRVSTVFPSDMK